MSGIVYLIKDEEKNNYKIGVTRNYDVEKRLKKLQTGNPGLLTIVMTHNCEYPFRMEKMLHSHFGDKHILNEWYDLTDDDVKDFPNICDRLSKTIKVLEDNPFFMKNIR